MNCSGVSRLRRIVSCQARGARLGWVPPPPVRLQPWPKVTSCPSPAPAGCRAEQGIRQTSHLLKGDVPTPTLRGAAANGWRLHPSELRARIDSGGSVSPLSPKGSQKHQNRRTHPMKSQRGKSVCYRPFAVVLSSLTRAQVPRGGPTGNGLIDAGGVDSPSESGRRGANLACRVVAGPDSDPVAVMACPREVRVQPQLALTDPRRVTFVSLARPGGGVA
jgi:hypothetical protein